MSVHVSPSRLFNCWLCLLLHYQLESINHATRSLALPVFPMIRVSVKAILYIKEYTCVFQDIVILGTEFCPLDSWLGDSQIWIAVYRNWLLLLFTGKLNTSYSFVLIFWVLWKNENKSIHQCFTALSLSAFIPDKTANSSISCFSASLPVRQLWMQYTFLGKELDLSALRFDILDRDYLHFEFWEPRSNSNYYVDWFVFQHLHWSGKRAKWYRGKLWPAAPCSNSWLFWQINYLPVSANSKQQAMASPKKQYFPPQHFPIWREFHEFYNICSTLVSYEPFYFLSQDKLKLELIWDPVK